MKKIISILFVLSLASPSLLTAQNGTEESAPTETA
ncbi:toluene tolerance protein, partial [Leptospira santarosai]